MLKMNLAACALVLSSIFVQVAPQVMAQTAVLTGAVSKTTVVVPPVSKASYLNQGSQYINEEPQYIKPKTKHLVTRVYVKDNRTFFQRHPMIKHAAIGAGVGAAGGAAIGLISGRGIMRGALIGAGTGAGVGVVRSSQTLRRHPIVRDLATGGLVGLGIGGAARGRCGYLPGAGIGSAAGLGWGLLKYGL